MNKLIKNVDHVYTASGERIEIDHRNIKQGGSFLGAGGEAYAYKIDKRVFKIFFQVGNGAKHFVKPMEKDLQNKVALLTCFKSSSIFNPKELVYHNGKAVGFWMYYGEGEILMRLVSKSQLRKYGLLEGNLLLLLIERIRQIVAEAHAYRARIVDLHSKNWKVKFTDKGPIPLVFDVDGWSVGKFMPGALHELFEDYHADGNFTQDSDWFSWGILTFQLLTGMHPYEWDTKQYNPNITTVELMKKNLSVFAPIAKKPRIARDFGIIPPELLKWYKEVFQNGYRGEPPILDVSFDKVEEKLPPPQIIVQEPGEKKPKVNFLQKIVRLFLVEDEKPKPKKKNKLKGWFWHEDEPEIVVVKESEEVIAGETEEQSAIVDANSDSEDYLTLIEEVIPVIDDVLEITEEVKIEGENIDFECIYHHASDIPIKVFPCGVVLTNGNHLYCLDIKQFLKGEISENCEVVKVEDGWLIADTIDEKIEFLFIKKEDLSAHKVSCLFATLNKIFQRENQLYGISENKIYVLEYNSIDLTMTPTTNQYKFDPKSTEWFKGGVGVRSKKKFSIVILPSSETFTEIKVKELNGIHVVNGIYSKEYFAISGVDEEHRLIKWEFTLLEEGGYQHWDEFNDLNVVTLPKGLVISFEKDGLLEVYNPLPRQVAPKTDPVQGTMRIIPEKILTKNTPLYRWEEKLVMILNEKIYTAKVKK